MRSEFIFERDGDFAPPLSGLLNRMRRFFYMNFDLSRVTVCVFDYINNKINNFNKYIICPSGF